ncbi:pheromone precursor Phb2.2 B1 [Coprinopsis marcescibilis]|uniref:Pheromone Phb2.2 B1 n=1 Tax=Coprinopsis marcescibilis TaxID=230819 RepID=A0A5C3KGF4_COPMA|nr:pheromone precursor Phb2.2 B1 [Coprinopsis marcescibilis]
MDTFTSFEGLSLDIPHFEVAEDWSTSPDSDQLPVDQERMGAYDTYGAICVIS